MRIGRASPPCVNPGHDATLITALVAAERATGGDSDPELLARRVVAISGAETVLLAVSGESPVVRAGRRRWETAARAVLNNHVQADGSIYARALASGGRIAFAFANDAPDCSVLVSALANWVDVRVAQRSIANESDRAARAELRALRAQISPHFAFNAMSAIAALIRIDPDRAHSLLLDFADYTRYSFGHHGEYTTLAEELRSIEIYLSLERARFGDRLKAHVMVPPEVLSVPVPFLVLQPLVENAIRHGIEPLPHGGQVRVVAEDAGAIVRIEVEDDGAGSDPALVEDLLGARSDDQSQDHVGLRNIDERLRAVYGDEHGLVVETAPGAGTKIIVSIPKYRPEVIA